jgi:hypothetical protein
MADAASTYPANVDVEYPDRERDRLTSFFRLIVALPIVAILGLLTKATVHTQSEVYVVGSGGVVFFATVAMLLFRRKYPRWWFDWNLELTRFSTRVAAYLALLRDEYPSTDEQQAVHVEIAYPDATTLDRWLPLVKWLLAIPHYVVLAFLSAAAFACVVVAWFAILFTRRYPRPLFDFVVGVLRWWIRVAAYAFVLVTDRYPPFSLSAHVP